MSFLYTDLKSAIFLKLKIADFKTIKTSFLKVIHIPKTIKTSFFNYQNVFFRLSKRLF